MKKIIIVGIVSSLMSGVVYATNEYHPKPPKPSNPQVVKSNSSSSVESVIQNKNDVKSTSSSSSVSTASANPSANVSGLVMSSDLSFGGMKFEAQKRDPVASASAAFLTATEDTCMGSSGVGAQGVSFGINLSSTWTDKNCERLKNSRHLYNMGYVDAARNLMCNNDEVRDALEASGAKCPQKKSSETQYGLKSTD